jgi:phospholipase C
MRGVRGFNDRAAPLLPSGLSPFYQPSRPPPPHSILCGCVDPAKPKASCSVSFTEAGQDLEGILMNADCDDLTSTLKAATPPVPVVLGEACSKFMHALYNTEVENLVVKQFLKQEPACPAGAFVDPFTAAAAAKKAAGGGGGGGEPPLRSDPSLNYTLPFPLSFDRSAASCMGAPEMAYPSNMNILNGGKADGWNTARDPGYGMSYFNRSDLPYYFALSDAFTVGDQYFQSTFTATCPNREFLFSGSNGLSVSSLLPKKNPNDYCMLDDSQPSTPGFAWETMGETLMRHNVSWRLYQGEDNFDDNGFAWFDNYRHAQPGEPLYDLGMARVNSSTPYGFVDAWEQDIAAGTLPQVSWLVGPAALSEHASNHPADGEDLSHRIIDVLQRHPDVYAKTVFVLNYDEGGQFVDHVVPPAPPAEGNSPRGGGGKMSPVLTADGELTTQPYSTIPPGHPIGPGWRVPLFLISPWSRGDYVFSEVSDHSSVIQFIEQVFDVQCPNISPWRRAVTSDLTAAFDFAHPDYSWPKTAWPDTSNATVASQAQCDNNPPPMVPVRQHMATQEPGVKKQRAIPSYVFAVEESLLVVDAKDELSVLTLAILNQGKGTSPGASTAAVFNVYDRHAVGPANNFTMDPPRRYTVAQGDAGVVSDTWDAFNQGKGYDLHLHGPNGFVRMFAGPGDGTQALAARLSYNANAGTVEVTVKNDGADSVTLLVSDNAYGATVTPKGGVVRVAGGGSTSNPVSVGVADAGNWYDVTITVQEPAGDMTNSRDAGKVPRASARNSRVWSRRFMGKMETGKETTTDPAMGKGVPALGHEDAEIERQRVHPPMPRDVARLGHVRWSEEWGMTQCDSDRAKYKDACYDYSSARDEL